jgi:hypothetical protein
MIMYYNSDSKSSDPAIIPHADLRKPRKDFVIVTAIFNPRGFKRRYELYRQFENYVINSSALLMTVEVALGDRPWEVTECNNPWNVQLRTDWELWHKESALNVGINRALQNNPDIKYIAWIDADVSFSRSDWPAATCEALQHHRIIQMFGDFCDLDANEHVQWTGKGLIRLYQDQGFHFQKKKQRVSGHPGLAWAARRDTLDKLGGLLNFAVSGSADTHMANALLGYRNAGDSVSTLEGRPKGFLHILNKWADLADEYVKGDVGYLPGTILHYWHGSAKRRGHRERWAAEKFHKFDPYNDLVRDLSGLYRLAPGREKLGDDIRRSLSQRNEDGIDK